MPVSWLSSGGFDSGSYALGVLELLVPFAGADRAQLQDIVDDRRLTSGSIADAKGAAGGL